MKKEEGKIWLILWLGKNWKAWVPIIVSIVALVIYFRIAKETHETSNYQFLQVNRPYIILSPTRFDDEKFWQIKQEGKIIKIDLKYEMKNDGNIIAKDIAFPDKVLLLPWEKSKKGFLAYYDKTGKVTISPGDIFYISQSIVAEHENEETAKNFYEDLISDKYPGLDVSLWVNYTNELDETQRYRTLVEYKINKNTAHLLKSETLNPSDEILTK